MLAKIAARIAIRTRTPNLILIDYHVVCISGVAHHFEKKLMGAFHAAHFWHQMYTLRECPCNTGLPVVCFHFMFFFGLFLSPIKEAQSLCAFFFCWGEKKMKL
jgi:hypothetical protein